MSDAQLKAQFADRLRELLCGEKWTLNEAAARLSALSAESVSIQTWASWEAGHSMPFQALGQRLAGLFNVIDGEFERLDELALPAARP